MKKITKNALLVGIMAVLVYVIYVINEYTMVVAIRGIGISFPPNSCDLKFGYEVDAYFQSAYARDVCLFRKAQKLGDIKLCHEIKKGIQHRDCVIAIAVLRNDHQVCDETIEIDDRWICISHLARVTDDKELCLNIERDDMRKQCLASFDRF